MILIFVSVKSTSRSSCKWKMLRLTFCNWYIASNMRFVHVLQMIADSWRWLTLGTFMLLQMTSHSSGRWLIPLCTFAIFSLSILFINIYSYCFYTFIGINIASKNMVIYTLLVFLLTSFHKSTENTNSTVSYHLSRETMATYWRQ